MAVALEVGIGDLILELLAHALVLLRPCQPARAVAAGALQTLADSPDDLGIVVETNLHGCALLCVCINRGC